MLLTHELCYLSNDTMFDDAANRASHPKGHTSSLCSLLNCINTKCTSHVIANENAALSCSALLFDPRFSYMLSTLPQVGH